MTAKNNIPNLLKSAGMNPPALARKIGYSEQAMYNLVNSPEIPDRTYFVTLKRIADVFGVKIDDLMIEVEGDAVAEANN